MASVQLTFDRIFVLFSFVNSYKIEDFIMDQIKDRIKLVDTTLLSLEQVYTTLSHVSLKKKAFFCLLCSYIIVVGVHNKSVRKGGRSKLLEGPK